jgi:hypothetical protein
LLQVDATVVTTGRMVRFLGATVTTERRGPNGGDDRADGAVLGCGGDDDGDGGGRGGGMVPGTTVKAKEERDDDGGGGVGWLSSRVRW